MITRISVVAAVAFSLLVSACSSDDAQAPTGKPKGGKGGTSAEPAEEETPEGETPVKSTPDPIPLPAPTSKTACQLPAMTATDVAPSFTYYDPPNVEPPAAKGGKIDGKYIIDKATVYLPTSTKGLVKLQETTGKVNGWATFSGEDYRLSLKADLAVKPIIGAVQQQQIDAQGQGTFKAEGSNLKLLTACPGSTAPAADISFSENGNRGTLVIKTVIETRGDAYVMLEATRAQ